MALFNFYVLGVVKAHDALIKAQQTLTSLVALVSVFKACLIPAPAFVTRHVLRYASAALRAHNVKDFYSFAAPLCSMSVATKGRRASANFQIVIFIFLTSVMPLVLGKLSESLLACYVRRIVTSRDMDPRTLERLNCDPDSESDDEEREAICAAHAAADGQAAPTPEQTAAIGCVSDLAHS